MDKELHHCCNQRGKKVDHIDTPPLMEKYPDKNFTLYVPSPKLKNGWKKGMI